MTKIKNLFATPLKAILTCVCILAALLLIGTVTVAAVSAAARNNAIGSDQAINFALADAGVDPAVAQVGRAEFDYENGHFVYEIEFIANGVEYDYLIKASDGSVVKKESEVKNAAQVNNGAQTNNAQTITLEDAKAAALADAGLSEGDVTFTKTASDFDDGRQVYDVEFYTADTEYEYEIDASNGQIFSKSKETFTAAPSAPAATGQDSQSNTQQPAATGEITLDEAKTIALSDAGVSESAVTFTKARLDLDDGARVYDVEFYTSDKKYEYEISAANGSIVSRETETFITGAQQSASGADITLEEAKTIALSDAGVSSSDATFTKARLDYDDGIAVYELEFYTSDREYDYDVNASSGSIISRESEAFKTNTQTQQTTGSADITLEEAKSIALSDAGVSSSAATFTKARLDRDDGITVYELEFYTSDTEYDYEVNASTGAVMSRESEAFRTSQTQQPSSSGDITADEAKSIALSDAGVSSSEATITKSKLDYDDGIRVYDIEFYTSEREYEYEINASTGKVVSRSSEAFRVGNGNVGSTSFIGVDRAKEIATEHAGVSSSSVTFSKAKLENDDGYTVYEIEFYYNGMEYEYTINASTGAIMEYDYDRD